MRGSAFRYKSVWPRVRESGVCIQNPSDNCFKLSCFREPEIPGRVTQRGDPWTVKFYACRMNLGNDAQKCNAWLDGHFEVGCGIDTGRQLNIDSYQTDGPSGTPPLHMVNENSSTVAYFGLQPYLWVNFHPQHELLHGQFEPVWDSCCALAKLSSCDFLVCCGHWRCVVNTAVHTHISHMPPVTTFSCRPINKAILKFPNELRFTAGAVRQIV